MREHLAKSPNPPKSFDDLVGEVSKLNHLLPKYLFWLRAAVTAFLVAVLVGGYFIYDNHRTSDKTDETAATAKTAADLANEAIDDLTRALRCQEHYERQQRQRTLILTEVNARLNAARKAKDDALDNLVRAAIQQSPKVQPLTGIWLRKAHQYDVAYRHYIIALRKHPIPPPPRFSCAKVVAPPKHPGASPSPSPSAPAPAPSTVVVPGPTVTRTQTRPGPTVTRTVYAPPGKGRTVTATRTTTVTVTAPNPLCTIVPGVNTC